MLCIKDLGGQMVFSEDPVLARLMRSNPYSFGKGGRLWTYTGCTARPVVDEKHEPVFLLDSAIKSLDSKYLVEKAALVIYIQDSTNKKKIILVPGTDCIRLINDSEQIDKILEKLTKRKTGPDGKQIEEKKKVYDFGKYVDEEERVLYSLKRIILNHEELLSIWSFLVDENSLNYRSAIACSKNCTEAIFITKCGDELLQQRFVLNQHGLKFDDLTNCVLEVTIR